MSIVFARTITSEQHRGSSSSSDATECTLRLLPQKARSIIVLQRTSSFCCTSPWTLVSSNGLPSIFTATPYISSVWARWTMRLICRQASATEASTGSRSRSSARFQHSTSRKRENCFKSFFFCRGARFADGPAKGSDMWRDAELAGSLCGCDCPVDVWKLFVVGKRTKERAITESRSGTWPRENPHFSILPCFL